MSATLTKNRVAEHNGKLAAKEDYLYDLYWVRDLKVESLLTRLSIKFSYIKYKPEEVDRKQSQENNSRPHRISDEAVDTYRIGKRQGDKFPMPVVRRDPKTGRLIYVSGNHRDAMAVREKIPYFLAYLIETDNLETLVTLPRALNAIESSLTLTTSDKVANALYYKKNLGWEHRKACKEARVSESTVARAEKCNEVRERVALYGVQPDNMSRSAISELHHIVPNVVLAEATTLANRCKFSEEEVKELVTKLQVKKGDEQNQLEVVRKEAEKRGVSCDPGEIEEVKAKPKEQNRATKLRMAVTRLNNMVSYKRPLTWYIPKESDQVAVKESIKELTGYLKRLLG